MYPEELRQNNPGVQGSAIEKRVLRAAVYCLSLPDGPIPPMPLAMAPAEAPDDEMIDLTHDRNYPNAVEGDTPEQLYETMLAFYETLGRPDAVHADDLREIDGVIFHETDHGEAILAHDALAQDLVYGLWIRPIGRGATGKLEAVPFTTVRQARVTKLGLAAIIAAPEQPSTTDVHVLREMGYAGPEDVARRVISHNERNPRQIPVPKIAESPGFTI